MEGYEPGTIGSLFKLGDSKLPNLEYCFIKPDSKEDLERRERISEELLRLNNFSRN